MYTVIFFAEIRHAHLNFRLLVEYRPSWPKFNPWLVFSAPIWVKFGQFKKNRLKSVAVFERISAKKILLCIAFFEVFSPLIGFLDVRL
jgi:hypothetical protein